MTKTLKWLGGGIAAALLLGLAGLFSGATAEAQPESPPARFVGSVSIDGEGAAAGTSVTAMVDGSECGSGTVTTGAAGSRYAINVPSSCAGEGDTVSFRIGMYDAAETGEWDNTGLNQLDLSYTTPPPPPPPPPPAECPDGYARADDGMMSDDMSGDMDDGPAEPEAMNGDEPAEPMEPSEPAEPMEPSDGDMDDGDMMDIPEGCEPIEDDDDMTAPDPGDTGTGLASPTTTTTTLAALLGLTALTVTLALTHARRRR